MSSPFRVLLLVDCFYPVTKSAPKMIHDLATEFVAMGYEATILAPSEFISSPLAFDSLGGVEVVRVKYPRLKGALRVLRGLGELFLSPLLWRKTRKLLSARRYDLIVFYSPTIFLGPLIKRLKALWRCPSYLVLRDIWPQFLVDTGVLSRGPLLKVFERFEQVQNDSADVIGVQTAGDLQHFEGESKVEVLQNWITVKEQRPDKRFRAKYGFEDKVIFLYGGNFGIAQDLENLLRLAEALRDHNEAVFVFLGSGTEEGKLKDYAARNDLRNVLFLPAVDQEAFESIVAASDVGMISLHHKFSIQNVPGKLLSYLNASKPVLCSVNAGNDLFGLVAKAQAGFCILNSDDKTLVEAAIKLLKSKDLRALCGSSGRSYLERHLTVQAAARQILSHFGRVTATSSVDSVSTT